MVDAMKIRTPARRRLACFEESKHGRSITPNGDRTYAAEVSKEPLAMKKETKQMVASTPTRSTTTATHHGADTVPAAKRPRRSPRSSPNPTASTPERNARTRLMVSLLSDDDTEEKEEEEDSKMPARTTVVSSSSSSSHRKRKGSSDHHALPKSSKKLFGPGTQTLPTNPPQSSANTLKAWLQTTPPEEIERVNREFWENASNATEEDCTRSQKTECQTMLRNKIFRDEALSNLTEQELADLNEKALRRAMSGPTPVDRCYTLLEFRAMMDKARDHFLDLDELEATRAVRKANQTVERRDSTNQTRAQYGRTMLTSAEFLLGTIGKLERGHVFCDIGHGIGNLPIQAALTRGCESRGIEMVGDRHAIALCLNEFYQDQHKLISDQEGETRSVGKVRLRHGSLEDRDHRDFLTHDVDLLYCNNYNGVFNVRANERSVNWCLDDYIAGLFTQLKPGAKLVTLYEIQRLPLPLEKANELRIKNGLPPSNSASFYTLEMISDPGGDDKLTFTKKAFSYFVYTRVGGATFTCAERSCDYNAIPVPAFEIKMKGHAEERLVPVTACPLCGEKRTTRRRDATGSPSFRFVPT